MKSNRSEMIVRISGLCVCFGGVMGVACGPTSVLGLLGASEEEFAAFQAEVDAFNTQADETPLVAVRIINETSAPASVSLQAGLSGFPNAGSDILGLGYVDYSAEDAVSEIDTREALISANGEAEGSIKCGDAIAITVTAPHNLAGLFSDAYSDGISSAPGLYLYPGNASISGLGDSGSDFTGDIVSLVRVIRPADDGVDCATSTLVIRIQTAATADVHDDVTGDLVTAGAPGTAVIELE